MTELPVGMSVGVCGVFFKVFQSVWVCVGVLRNAEMSGNGRSLVKRHRIVTKLPVGMSVGVCGVFFDVFGSVWVCVGVCGCVWVCVGVCGGFSRNPI